MGAGASLAVCVCVTRQSMEVDGWQQGRGGAHGILSFRWTAPDSRPSTMSSNPFGDSRKGDDAHLREILGGKDSKEKVTAVKNVIYAMTVGKDMSRLFMDGRCRDAAVVAAGGRNRVAALKPQAAA